MPIMIRPDSEFTDLLRNNLRVRYDERKKERTVLAPIHVSDILPSSCIRKQYYSRVFPDEAPITDQPIHHSVRGETSELAITKLTKSSVAQAELQMDRIVYHPDIIDTTRDKTIIIELKDTVAG